MSAPLSLTATGRWQAVAPAGNRQSLSFTTTLTVGTAEPATQPGL